MSSTALKHPSRTLLEVFKSLPEGTLAQLIENNLVMSPPPSDNHQKILIEISAQLFAFVRQYQLGEVRVAPYDVFLDLKNAYQPDIVFISKDNLHLIKEDGLHGAPDLLIEILSPSTAKDDLEEKKDVYERCGVKEYWVVDPTTKSTQGYALKDGSFGEIEKTTGVIHSWLLDTEFRF
jgi:Uma2 family endonuclease